MLRAILLASLLLVTGAGMASAESGCDPALGDVCWDEARSGPCTQPAEGRTNVRAENPMLGFPLRANFTGKTQCVSGQSATRTMTTEVAAGQHAQVVLFWQSQESGWRWMRITTSGAAGSSSTDWYGSSTCTLSTFGTFAGLGITDTRACPILPPSQPAVAWGNVLPLP